MVNTDDTTIIALLISLVALFISLIQLVVGLSATAEGSKRCNEATLGRWRKWPLVDWHWTRQARFQVVFTTPHIQLLSAKTDCYPKAVDEFYRFDRRTAKLHLLANGTLPAKLETWWRDKLGSGKTSKKQVKARSETNRKEGKSRKGSPVGRQIFDGNTKKLEGDTNGRKDNANPRSIEDGKPTAHVQARSQFNLVIWPGWKKWWHAWHNWRRSRRELTKGGEEVRVTWDRLLQRLFQQQEKNLVKLAGELCAQRDMTAIFLDLRVRKWEYMPSDIIRPLASTSLGQLLVLAQRLGLRWRVINPGEGQLRAEGDGCSITSTYAPNFGTIIRYSELSERLDAQSDANYDKLLIPSIYVDKMLCGIVAGEPTLLPKREHFWNDDNRKPRPRQFFTELNANGWAHSVNDRNNMWFRININDALALLSPFLPIQGLPVSRIISPAAWDGTGIGYVVSFFHFWEARKVLWKRLEEIIDKKKVPEGKVPAGMIKALAHFKALQEPLFEHDFYCNWKYSLIHPDGKLDPELDRKLDPKFELDAVESDESERRLRHRSELQNRLRDIWEDTQKFFITRENAFRMQEGMNTLEAVEGEWASTDAPPISYFQLWRAHNSASSEAVVRFQFEMDRLKDDDKFDSAKREKLKMQRERREQDRRICEHEGSRGPGFALEMALKTSALVDELPLIRAKLLQRSERVKDVDIDEAWWMMVVRGIAWNMSIWVEPADSGSIVPSSLFNNKSQVWLI